MKRFIIMLLCVAVGVVNCYAQALTIKGTVTSKTDGTPLIGATVVIDGTTNGTMTDIDGKYTLSNIKADNTIVVSYVGYTDKSIKVDGRTTIDVALDEKASQLDEVVVVGYGVAKRSDLTSSISSVKGSEITKTTIGNAMDALQGKVNGVQVVSGGGPGSTPKVIIRGITSVNGSDPLYVVDGVPLNSNINFINNNDIESMEVLKDASASAIYGTRGSNGVVIITTKKGNFTQSGISKTEVDFSASVGFQNIQKPKMAWADEYEKVYKTRYSNDGRIAPWNSPYENYAPIDGVDWWKEIVNKCALVQNYSLSIRGGSDKYIYSLSLGYFRNNSQFDYGYWDKLNIRLNTEYKFNRIVKAGIDIAPNLESWDNSPNLFSAVMSMDPTTPIFRPESEWDSSNPMNNYQRSYNNQEWNPAGSLARMDNKTRKLSLLMNPYLQITPIKQLVLRTQFGLNFWYSRNDYYDCAFHIDALEQNAKNKVGRNTSDALNWTWNNTITYTDVFADKHHLTVMAGFTAERYSDWYLNGARQDVPSTSSLLHEVSAGTGDQFASGSVNYTTLASFLGRVMYNYDNRYYLTASVRSDGSSRFPKGHKFATFPSVSVAWRLSEESFMENAQSWLTNAKIRLGWGRVGNQSIGNGAYMTMLNSGVNYVFGDTAARYPATILGSMGNPNLKWETVEDVDLGIDASFFNGKLNVTFDLFQKTSHDMLYGKQSLLILGVPTWMGAITQNIGKMRARGWELAIDYNGQSGDFRYNIGLQLSATRNKAIKFTGDGPIWQGSGNLSESIIKNEDGTMISRFFGYQAQGLFQTWADVYNHTDEHGNLIQPDAQPGDIRFADRNHNGELDENDKTYIGNPYPDLTMGLNLSFYYKGFDLTANFYGTFGNDIFNLQRARYSGAQGQNVMRGTYNKCWHGEGTSNDYPRLSYNDLNQNYSRVSSFFVEDGSYFRCKLLTLGYTLPKNLTKQFNLRFYVSAQNPFTITGYSGMDPERPFYDGGAISTGIDYNNYPSPRSFLFGVDFKF